MEYTMIGHELHRSRSFWSFLLSIDKDLADSTRKQGCSCGGRLHCTNYPRAPRGGPDHLPKEYRCRFTFCCDRAGCRKRMTPPSVRFLGRKVYRAAVGPKRARFFYNGEAVVGVTGSIPPRAGGAAALRLRLRLFGRLRQLGPPPGGLVLLAPFLVKLDHPI